MKRGRYCHYTELSNVKHPDIVYEETFTDQTTAYKQLIHSRSARQRAKMHHHIQWIDEPPSNNKLYVPYNFTQNLSS